MEANCASTFATKQTVLRAQRLRWRGLGIGGLHGSALAEDRIAKGKEEQLLVPSPQTKNPSTAASPAKASKARKTE